MGGGEWLGLIERATAPSARTARFSRPFLFGGIALADVCNSIIWVANLVLLKSTESCEEAEPQNVLCKL